MKIAIHKRKNSFSDRWIEYCEKFKIEYKIIDCYSNDIISNLSDCDGLMWHWHQGDEKAILFAKELVKSLELSGKLVFPSSNASFHFDDKISQKYLFESLKIAHTKTNIFYEKKDAYKFLNRVSFPIVHKLRNGAGGSNVELIRSKRSAIKKVKKAFSKGFRPINRVGILRDNFNQMFRNVSFESTINFAKSVFFLFKKESAEKIRATERGYIYFQEFISKNNYDTRVIVIGNRCFGLRRENRKNDFRASGSGILKHNPNLIDKRCLKQSFKHSKVLKNECVAFDFIFDEYNNPLVIEISYGFSPGTAYDNCPGYWEEDLNWIEGKFKPEYFMIEDFINKIKKFNKYV